MTHQDVGEVLPGLLDQLPPGLPVDVVGCDGVYDTESSHTTIAARSA